MKRNVSISREERRRRLDAFDAIMIPHPRYRQVEEQTSLLIDDTEAIMKSNERRARAANGRPIKRKELWVLPIIGPSGATKSTSMARIVDEICCEPELAAGEIPVLYVTLDQNTRNSKRLQVQILEAFGEPGAEVVARSVQYSADVVDEDIRRIAIEKKTRVVVLDEGGNMLMHDAGKIRKQMAKAIKGLVNKAIFSIILMGTDEINTLFLDAELQSRNYGTIDFGRFDIKRSEDRKYFFTFVDRFEKRLLEEKIIDRPLDMVGDVQTRATVYDFANGIIGLGPRILRIALSDVTAKGRGHLEWEDVASAFHGWNLPREESAKHHNPFDESGPRKSTLAFVREDAKTKGAKAAEMS